MSALRSFLRRRPVISTGLAGAVSLTSYAFLVEHQAKRQEKRYGDSNTHNTIAALPQTYNWDALHDYWSHRPVSTVKRMAEIAWQLAPLGFNYLCDFVIPRYVLNADTTKNESLQHQHAVQLRHALTELGPAFVKAGQQLSIRPDLVPPVLLHELQKLCDSVQPVPDEIALSKLRDELQCDDDLRDIFVDTPVLVASASLGQVYKATLRKANDKQQQQQQQVVAIKVQRPNMLQSFSLDLYLLQRVGVIVDMFTSTFTNQPPFHKALYESFAKGSYGELDYLQEAAHQTWFRQEFAQRRNCANQVVVPKVYHEYTTRTVLTSEWMDGVKLADSPREQIQALIPVGVEIFLTQLLDMGKFHSDPHVGNLLVQADTGKLCLLDFGLCANVQESERNAMTAAIVHLLLRDFDALVSQDAKELGFLPADYDTTELKPLLTKILTVGLVESGSDLQKRKRKLMEISDELNEVFFQYPFSVPPFFALVTRGLGLLEGIALSADSEFDIFQASAPYARRRPIGLLGRDAFRTVTRQRKQDTTVTT